MVELKRKETRYPSSKVQESVRRGRKRESKRKRPIGGHFHCNAANLRKGRAGATGRICREKRRALRSLRRQTDTSPGKKKEIIPLPSKKGRLFCPEKRGSSRESVPAGERRPPVFKPERAEPLRERLLQSVRRKKGEWSLGKKRPKG